MSQMKEKLYTGLVAKFPMIIYLFLDLVYLYSIRSFFAAFRDLKSAIFGLKNDFLILGPLSENFFLFATKNEGSF